MPLLAVITHLTEADVTRPLLANYFLSTALAAAIELIQFTFCVVDNSEQCHSFERPFAELAGGRLFL